MKPITKAIILSGGFGKRMGPMTSHGHGVKNGNLHKSTLPIAGTPNIARLVQKMHSECGINDFYVNTHYLAGDVISVLGHGERFGPNIRINHDVTRKLLNTGMVVKRIVLDRFKDAFKKDDFFWVVSGDISFPTADLNDFQNSFMHMKRGFNNILRKNKILGGIGFVLRPPETMIKKHPSVLLDKYGIIRDLPFGKERNKSFGQKIRSLQEAQDLMNLSAYPGTENYRMIKKIPMNTSFYILSKKIFTTVTGPDETYDFGQYLFPQLSNKLWGYIFRENNLAKYLNVQEYHDLAYPEDFYRAQWSFIKTSFDLIQGDYIRRKEDRQNNLLIRNSWIGNNVHLTGRIRNTIIGNDVHVNGKSEIRNSIIGHGSYIINANLEGCVVLPFTYINYSPVSSDSPIKANHSILGGKIRGGSFLDPYHINTFNLYKILAVPGMGGKINLTDLEISDKDTYLPNAAFEEAVPEKLKMDSEQGISNFKDQE